MLKNNIIVLFAVSLFIMTQYSCQGVKEDRSDVIEQKNTPIIGWSSWNHFRTNISDTLIRQQADVMANSGMKEAGYEFINIDDGYFGGRDENGILYSDSSKFPEGMKAVADYIHSQGLKAGIYTDAGDNTCGSKFDQDEKGIGVGLYGHDQQDMDLFLKKWGYDFIKVDYCGGVWMGLDEKTRYTEVKHAIDNTGEDVVFNICRWEFPGTWAIPIAYSWRISADIRATFESILSIVDTSAYLAQYASPGSFNDMDMLQVGRGMSYEEDKAHFSMWSIMTSPLLAGNDLRDMSAETLQVLTNKEVIAVNQDPACIQARKIRDNGDHEVWVKPLGDAQSAIKAVALLNRSDSAANMSVQWSDIGIKGKASVRDLWEHADKGDFEQAYHVEVPSHGVVMLKISGEGTLPKRNYEAEYSFMNSYPKEDKATYAFLDDASGGVVAINIGNHPDNWIEFRDIFVEEEGEYELSISFISKDPKDLFVTINNEAEFKFNGLESGGDDKISTARQNVYLEKGYNLVKLHNPEAWAPDIDNLTIDKIKDKRL